MSVPRNMLKELLERKLWPIALVLIIALVAVPVLLTKKAPTDIVTPPTGPLPYSSGTTLPAISVQTTPGNSKLSGKGRNPFTPQKVAATTTTTAVVPTTTTTASAGAGTGTGAGTVDTGSGGSSSTGSGDGSAPVTTAPRHLDDPEHDRAGRAEHACAHRADRDPVLPRVARDHDLGRRRRHDRSARAAQHPAEQAAADARRAWRPAGWQERSVRGRARHRRQRRRHLHPGSDRLRDPRTHPGQTEGLSTQTGSGSTPVALFSVNSITADQHPSVAAANKARQTASDVGRELLNHSPLSALSLFQYDPSVGAVVDLRNLTVGGS